MANSTRGYTPEQVNSGMQNGFVDFMMQCRGKNSGDILQQMIGSGQYTQEQLNLAQQARAKLEKQLTGLRKMFHF